jgi:hypothetical protein
MTGHILLILFIATRRELVPCVSLNTVRIYNTFTTIVMREFTTTTMERRLRILNIEYRTV